MASQGPKILLIDSYDSFTHNLAHLVRRNVPSSQIYLIRNDALNYDTLLSLLPCFSAVVVGPGPGSPAIDVDIGVINKLWSLPDSQLLPVFGVCLGFQSLVLAFGGALRTMKVVKHGMISHIEHVGQDLFDGIPEDMEATRYHSLCVDIANGDPSSEIDPLAWANDGAENGRVLMAARHSRKPFWGVQYHPESVCTRGGGDAVIRNFWKLALKWTISTTRQVLPLPKWSSEHLGQPWPHLRPTHVLTTSTTLVSVSHMSLIIPHLSVTRVCELLGVNHPDTSFVVLDSAAKPGRFTIIGALMPSTLSVRYTVPERYVWLEHGAIRERVPLQPGISIWEWLAMFMGSKVIQDPGRGDVPFWGGFIGYLSYELGVAELEVPLKYRKGDERRNADVNLVFVERSIVIDGETGCVHIQSLIPDDDSWLQDTSHRLNETLSHPNPAELPITSLRCDITSPSREGYVAQVLQCKHHLSIGDSYELCLTAPSTLHIHDVSPLTSWDLYVRLRASNPAPYAAYLRLGPTTLLGSSPERFLRWDRSGRCQLRPIKGTLRKTIIDANGVKRTFDRKDANEMLGENIKERAENLMIVDLIRHDLGGMIEAADGVQVEQLMGIEEYETVWQMVSVITGNVHGDGGGWEVLRRSLPPGSMTGAPKKRSVELLQDIEGQERGVYSGVCGYWCVGGGGDWAVIIRSCFRYDPHKNDASPICHEDHHSNHQNSSVPHINGKEVLQTDGACEQGWTLGAGGAITALSDPVAEWEEMRVKLESVGRAFGVHEL